MAGSRKSESGTQLLARLSTRPDIKVIDPFIFGKVTASSGQLIELYGMEGVGKTEVALHCAARVCLPVSRYGIPLAGLEAKVIYIDAESKFSILRLAVVLEKLILEMQNSQLEKREFSEDISKNSDVRSENSNLKNEQQSNISQNNVQNETFHGSSSKNVNECHKNISSNSNFTRVLSPQDLEEVVGDSLGRVQILRPTNSQQLLASLLSLETILSEEPLYTLLIVDSISAFYWIDRLASPTSYQHLDSRIIPVAHVLKRYVSELGITCLITKSAFFSGKKVSDPENVGSVSGNSSSFEKLSLTYNEYLGKIWSTINTKIIILTSTSEIEEQNRTDETTNEEVKTVHAYCNFTETVKQYKFKNDLLLPITV